MLSGPWRLTEPCDFTIGGATWLDQAQETAARANQNAGPQVRRRGNREPHQSVKGGGSRIQTGSGGEEMQQTAADPHRKGTGPDNRPTTAKK